MNWFNAVDDTYRTDLRELNELNFGRFEARLKAELQEQEAEIIKWMFVFWAPTALGVLAMLLTR